MNWYPKIQSLASKRGQVKLEEAALEVSHFTDKHLAFIDEDELYFELQALKNFERWYNFNLPKSAIKPLLRDPEWYLVYIPKEEMQPRTFEQVRMWQEIAVTLLKKYCKRYYNYKRAEYEKDFLEYRLLGDDDSNLIDEYLFLIDQSRKDIVAKLLELKECIQKDEFRKMEFFKIAALFYGNHLYQPLIYANNEHVEVKPVALNDGEREFVEDLMQFHTKEKPFFKDKELYLLRNQSRGKGIGFFEAGNFYHDFIMWILHGERQYINFIDPKGIRNLQGTDDRKILFSQTIKEIESDLREQDQNITLNSFIISSTPFQAVKWWNADKDIDYFESRHVLFQQQDSHGNKPYIRKMLEMTLGNGSH